MAKGMNKVFLLGNVGGDPEVRSTKDGKVVANISLATSFVQDNKEQTEWHKIVAFERTAEIIRDYVKKGAQVLVEGRIRTRTWDDKGTKKTTTEILVYEVTLLGKPEGR